MTHSPGAFGPEFIAINDALYERQRAIDDARRYLGMALAALNHLGMAGRPPLLHDSTDYREASEAIGRLSKALEG